MLTQEQKRCLLTKLSPNPSGTIIKAVTQAGITGGFSGKINLGFTGNALALATQRKEAATPSKPKPVFLTGNNGKSNTFVQGWIATSSIGPGVRLPPKSAGFPDCQITKKHVFCGNENEPSLRIQTLPKTWAGETACHSFGCVRFVCNDTLRFRTDSYYKDGTSKPHAETEKRLVYLKAELRFCVKSLLLPCNKHSGISRCIQKLLGWQDKVSKVQIEECKTKYQADKSCVLHERLTTVHR